VYKKLRKYAIEFQLYRNGRAISVFFALYVLDICHWNTRKKMDIKGRNVFLTYGIRFVKKKKTYEIREM
jgi:hypothetical protein